MNPARILRRLGRLLPRFFDDRRGSADLNTYLLLTAAGCTMVGLTAPHLFKSSKTASDTFEKQVEILQRGAGGGSGGSGGGAGSGGSGGGWNLGGQGGQGGQLTGARGGGGSLTGGGGGSLTGGGGGSLTGGGATNGGGAASGGGAANGGGPTVTADAPGAPTGEAKKAPKE